MKSHSFPKLDRPKPKPLGEALTQRYAGAVDEKTWKAWRMQLGASRREANRLWLQHQEWVAQEALNGPVRALRVQPWQDWDKEFRAWLDEMPRKPYAFLAMVARLENKRAQQSVIAARKAQSRERYIRQYERRRAQRTSDDS